MFHKVLSVKRLKELAYELTVKSSILVLIALSPPKAQTDPHSVPSIQDTWLGKPVTLSAAYEAYVFIGVNLDVKPVWVEQIRKARRAGRAHLKVKVPIGVRGIYTVNTFVCSCFWYLS